VTHEELVEEMTAARKRVAEKTARAIRDARVVAVRAALPPGATREELEERARSFYPRLDDERIAEVATTILEQQAGGAEAGMARQAAAVAAAAAEAEIEDLPLDAEVDLEIDPELAPVEDPAE
jgi:hypothetical protein